MAEKLKLVERFEELRAGMIVVVKPCGRCAAAHRGMLTKLYTGPAAWADGHPAGIRDAWLMLPPCCRGEMVGFTEHAVARKMIFRVVDGLEDDKHTAESVASERRVALRQR